MATFLLIRHGAHLLGGDRLAGDTPVKLSPLGHEQVAAMVERVAKVPVKAIYSSPIERTKQTAAALAARLQLPVTYREELAEVGFGEWIGKTFDVLDADQRWKQWNTFRSGSGAPGGERMIDVQRRIVGEMLRLWEVHGHDVVALVSHGDVIKAAAAYFLGVPLDLFLRIEISLASVTVIRVEEGGPWVLGVNGTGEVVMG
ncbi:MAG TPA: histidine phosphatase family protein [Phycisphaerales bacterium]|nr:histidine phosphatase family protein [Phycisphaerales bacterium]